jgi:hypothetical protein
MNNPVTTSSDISYASQAGMKHWDEKIGTVIGRLHLADAYLARITVGDWQQRRERTEWLKGQIGPLVRQTDPKEILGDPGLTGLVRSLWGEAGISRLRDKVAACATPNVETTTTPK